MLESMSTPQFIEWLAYAQLEPFDEWRADYRAASLMAVITNVMTRTKESDPVKTPGEFMELFDFEKALDEHEAQEEIPEHERLWNKVRTAFGGLVTPLSRSTGTSPQMPTKSNGNLGGEGIE